jgi:hypothetical protein
MLCIACQQASKTIVTFGRARSLARIAENKLVKVCLAYQAKNLETRTWHDYQNLFTHLS